MQYVKSDKGAPEVEAAVYSNMPAGKRDDPVERLAWAFEDSVLQPMLQTGASLVAHGASAGDGQKADIVIDLAVSRFENNQGGFGYNFRAIAKEVESGRLLGSVNSEQWRQQGVWDANITPASKEYEIGSVSTWIEAGDMLSYELMDAMANSWGR